MENKSIRVSLEECIYYKVSNCVVKFRDCELKNKIFNRGIQEY
jgi:hypothetical protein